MGNTQPMRPQHLFLVLAGTLLATALITLAGVSWLYAGVFRDIALKVGQAPAYDLEITAVTARSVTLRSTSVRTAHLVQTPGLWGLQWPEGYAQLGESLGRNSRGTERVIISTDAPLTVGLHARLDEGAFMPNPAAVGLTFQNVQVTSSLGAFPAWYVPSTRSAWVIVVHGKAVTRSATLRVLPSLNRAGYPTLVITYRNDPGLPSSKSGYYEWGASEWEEVEGAVRYALDHGASGVTLMGYNMGGGMITNFMYKSPLAAHVSGLVLDSPMLKLSAAVEFGAKQRHLPVMMSNLGRRVASWRFDLDWEAVDYTRNASALQVPILLFHGTDDDRAPITVSAAFAKALPNSVDYEVIPNATHARSWNVAPAVYEATLTNFLTRVTR